MPHGAGVLGGADAGGVRVGRGSGLGADDQALQFAAGAEKGVAAPPG